jgi:large subunit ribosomal protein L18
MTIALREIKRIGRHDRIRKKVQGTVERPRLSVHRSKRNLVGQLIDDLNRKTVFAFSTLDKKFAKASKKGNTVAAAQALGKLVSQEMKAKGFIKIAFDRGGYPYHGRIKALAEALREGGIQF